MSGVINIFVSGLDYVDGTWVRKHSFSDFYTVKSGYDVAYRWRLSRESGMGEGTDRVGKEKNMESAVEGAGT